MKRILAAALALLMTIPSTAIPIQANTTDPPPISDEFLLARPLPEEEEEEEWGEEVVDIMDNSNSLSERAVKWHGQFLDNAICICNV